MLSTTHLERALSRLPEDRPFTTADALKRRVSGHALQELVRRGYLRRPLRSVHVRATMPDTLRLRVAMLERIVPPGCFITDHTAAWLHAGDEVLLPNAHVKTPKPDIFRHSDVRGLRNSLVRSGERHVLARDLVEVGSLRVTSPLRTACDLGRLFSRDVAMWGLDSMLATRAFVLDELLAELPRYRRRRGVVQLRALAPLADAGSASFGESALRLRWYDASLPRPFCQVPVTVGATTYWLDLGLEELRFAAEYDGAAWHQEASAARDAERRSALADEGDWTILVFRSADVFGGEQNADKILRRAYREIRVRRSA